MSEFELVVIVLSFIIGFGVNEILASLVIVARDPERVRVDWLPIIWALAILCHQFQFWFGTLFLEQSFGLSIGLFWLLVFVAILLYLAGGMILPSRGDPEREGRSGGFDESGIRALLPLTAFTLIATVVNVWAGYGWTDPAVALNVLLTALSGLALVVRRRSIRLGAAVTYAAVLVFGILFVWARPGSIVH
jgi:hypothetical protein